VNKIFFQVPAVKPAKAVSLKSTHVCHKGAVRTENYKEITSTRRVLPF